MKHRLLSPHHHHHHGDIPDDADSDDDDDIDEDDDDDDDDDEYLTRDEFNLHKVIVTVTEAGKVKGCVDSSSFSDAIYRGSVCILVFKSCAIFKSCTIRQ